MAEAASGVWLYAVAADVDPADLDGVVGVAAEPVRVIEAAGLAAVGGSVGLDEFGAEALRRNLEDLDWLADKARAHDLVVRAVAAAGAALPLRLATVYLDDDRVREWLALRGKEFATALRLLAGRQEWGVKIYHNETERRGDAGGETSGAAYLRRRQEQLAARRTARGQAARDASEIHTALTTVAVATRLHPVQDARLTGVTAPMVLNGAYLVDRAQADEFVRLATGLDGEHHGIRVVVTGPWPAYSFASLPEEVRR